MPTLPHAWPKTELEGRVLGVSWDGTGYGPDGTVWGGEFLLTDDTGFHSCRLLPQDSGCREAHLRSEEPRRTALGLLFEMLGDSAFSGKRILILSALSATPEISVLARMLQKGIHSPWTTSAGRLFDAVASLSGLRQWIRFEGQAAMELEFAIGSEKTGESYPFAISKQADPEPAELASRI